jgi:hypothetical protein
MMTIDQIRQALQDRKLAVVSDATGLHYNTIYKIKSGTNTNPSYETMRVLSAYLAGQCDAIR